jgi:hypothetical protein
MLDSTRILIVNEHGLLSLGELMSFHHLSKAGREVRPNSSGGTGMKIEKWTMHPRSRELPQKSL